MANFFASYPPLPSGSGSDGVSSLNTLTGDVVLAAGTNITITPSGNTLTIAASGGGGGGTWGSITGSDPQLSPAGGFTGELLIVDDDGVQDATLLLRSDGFTGIQLTQDDTLGHVTFEVMDAAKNLTVQAGSTSGVTFLGQCGGSTGGLQTYSSIAYSIIYGFLGANGDNVHSIGTDETGALVAGNRWKDGLFGTSLRAPLFTSVNESSSITASTVSFLGVHNTGSGPGGTALIAGGTGGDDGFVQIGNDSTTPQHVLNTATATNAAGILTLLNAPAGISGSPTGYISIMINGVPSVIPFWQ